MAFPFAHYAFYGLAFLAWPLKASDRYLRGTGGGNFLRPPIDDVNFLALLGIPSPARISVGGLSSGADFAVQFQVAFSETVTGAAIFAGQPYRCATQRFPTDILVALSPEVPVCEGCPAGKTLEYDHCKHNASVVEVQLLKTVAQNYASQGLIDNITHLERARVYFYRGTKDNHYGQGSVAKTRDFFAEFVPASQLLLKNDIPSGHAYPLPGSSPWPCGTWPVIDLPFQNCDYDGPGAALQHIYGGVLAPPAGEASLSALKWFDQEPFYGDEDITGLARWGLVYVPTSCESASNRACDLFVSFHGCGFTVPGTFELLVTELNFNAWAETNHIVVLYPHLASHGSTTEQQDGCWNVYGQTGDTYATRDAPQMRAARQMVEQVGNLKIWGPLEYLITV
ncbi:unnamed protein product [Polarella glacialis]|uniref:Uncharacterized protein n=1 Tax=Polarella glacialis TaxID=89957 RepID=A0A813LUF9_POLGL|nr:unnamed protein product [Polarella glacialis]CAE8618274.1 unnamed protein product [Polarella glacialis]CAE8743755.1 unnamed protein product [Polarella glacialis]